MSKKVVEYTADAVEGNRVVRMYYVGGGNSRRSGSATGRDYWFYEGTPTEVDERDVPGFLAVTKLVTACCGSYGKSLMHLYQIA
jgi:hypothetical protein